MRVSIRGDRPCIMRLASASATTLPQGERGRSGFPSTVRSRLRGAQQPQSDQADSGASANRTGVYLAMLQLVFTLGWTTYVIYLPKLAAEVGIAPSAVILILMLDQAIFTITDTAMGIAADKMRAVCRPARRVRRRLDRDLLRGLRGAAVRRRHRAGRARSGSSR